MRNYIFSILLLFFTTTCTAQLKIGPTIGIGKSYTTLIDPEPFMSSTQNTKLYPTFGFKLELPLSRLIFITANSNFLKTNYKVLIDGFLRWDETLISHQINSNLTVNFIFKTKYSVGLGAYHLYSRHSKLKFSYLPSFSNLGFVVPFTFATKNLIFELSYYKSFRSYYNTLTMEKYSHLMVKPITFINLTISYLFNTKLNFSKKGIDCPRF